MSRSSVNDTPENIATEQAVNTWIRADLTADFVHPNTRGYRLMGESIDLKLFGKLR